ADRDARGRGAVLAGDRFERPFGARGAAAGLMRPVVDEAAPRLQLQDLCWSDELALHLPAVAIRATHPRLDRSAAGKPAVELLRLNQALLDSFRRGVDVDGEDDVTAAGGVVGEQRGRAGLEIRPHV